MAPLLLLQWSMGNVSRLKLTFFKLLFIESFVLLLSYSVHLFLFFKKWANPSLFWFIFILFSLQFQHKLKKHRWCAWDSNPGPQDGRRRWNHRAMAATLLSVHLFVKNLDLEFHLQSLYIWIKFSYARYVEWRRLCCSKRLFCVLASFIESYNLLLDSQQQIYSSQGNYLLFDKVD